MGHRTDAPVEAGSAARPGTPDDADEIIRLRSELILSEPLDAERLERDGVTLLELHASVDAAPLYEQFGFRSDPALMRMTRLPSPPEGEGV
ncbi:hypothetical protein ABT154_08880 [Streptomyces sp. NPDC001728]|uniref:GNAT family N-acetyltransferase n=1 Tax=Streptomyces sp. NPDC001728 TaxID=3154396 RepID=UPI00332D6A6A